MKFNVKPVGTRFAAEAVVLTYFAKQRPEAQPLWRQLRATERRLVTRYFRTKEFTGKIGEVKVVPRLPKGKLVVLGLGERPKWNTRKLVLMARRMVGVAKVEKALNLALALEPLAVSGVSWERITQTVAENMVMANYDFAKYKQKANEGFTVAALSLVVSQAVLSAARAGVNIGQVVGEQVNLARDLGNTPGGEMTPSLLARKAQEVGRASKIRVKVLGRAELRRMKMGAILGVAEGSAEEPKFIIMEYYGGAKRQAPCVFVGKGVTFDTGGLNLKPDKAMNDMHLDMSGGAAVMSALGAIARLKLKVNIVGLVPAVENMPGSAGYRPGDLLKGLSGKTIEVLNTDAEGRVILSDALTYAERFKPKLVVDLATLTGACMVALGLRCSGLFTPDIKLQVELAGVGENSGDYVWPLPMWEEYEEEVKGTFGDVQNVGRSRYGDAIAGAMFLWQFAKSYPWAHLDIAGPMKTFDGQYLSAGASGVGVRFLVELARAYSGAS